MRPRSSQMTWGMAHHGDEAHSGAHVFYFPGKLVVDASCAAQAPHYAHTRRPSHGASLTASQHPVCQMVVDVLLLKKPYRFPAASPLEQDQSRKQQQHAR